MEGTGATGAAIALSTEDAVCCRASTGAPAPEVGTRLHAGISLTELCLETGEVLLCNDTSTDRRVDPRLCKEMGVRSVLVLPIKQNAKAVGVLLLLSINPNAFNQHDATAMSKLADGVLPLSSESATIPDRCLDQLPSSHMRREGISKNSWPMPMCSRSITTAYRPRTRLKRPNGTRTTLDHNYLISRGYDEPRASKWGSLVNNRTGHCPCSGNLRLRISPQSSKSSNKRRHSPIAAANHKPAIPNQQHMLSEQDKKTNGQPEPSHECTNSHQARGYSSNPGTSSGHGCESHTQPSRRG